MNRRQKIIVSVTGIFIVLLVLLGLTYAYFLTRITGNSNPTSISTTTANLELVYGDGTTSILTNSNPIEPGKFSSSKDFTVTNNGNALTDYAVTLEDFAFFYANDTVIDGVSVKAGTVTKMEYPDDMKMTLTCEIESDDDTRNGTACGNIDSTLPTENSILLTNSIEVGDTHKYVLTLTYVDSGIDQSKDMNKTIRGKIDIIDLKNTIDLTGSVANYQSGDYVEINSTPIKSEIVEGKYKIIGVGPGNHTLNVKYKDSSGIVQTRGSQSLILKKGQSASVNGNTITFTDASRVATVDINSDYTISVHEEIKENEKKEVPMLAASDTWYQGRTKRSTLTTINIVDTADEATATSATESWPAAVDADGDGTNNDDVMCYVNGTELTIAGDGSGSILMNYDSSYVFSDSTDSKDYFSSVTTISNADLLDTSKANTMEKLFWNAYSLKTVDLENWNTSNVTSLLLAFASSTSSKPMSFTSLDLSNWNTSKVTNMRGAFQLNTKLESLDIGTWDTGSVKDMSNMFTRCQSLSTLDVSNFDTSNVTNMSMMFHIQDGMPVGSIDVSNWDVSKVTTFDHFMAHSKLVLKGVENWKITSATTNMNGMFHTCQNTTLDVSGWDTSNVTTFDQMFELCDKLTKIIGLEDFDTSNGIGFSEMFKGASKISELVLSSFDTRNAKNNVQISSNGNKSKTLFDMFLGANRLRKITLGENFSFNGNGSNTTAANIGVLPTPKSNYISGATGYWYNEDGSYAYEPAYIPDKTAGTYYAIPRGSNTIYVPSKEQAQPEDASLFQKVEYIEATGTQYIDTGFVPNQDTRVVADFQFTETSGTFLFGSRASTSSKAYNVNISKSNFVTAYESSGNTILTTADTNRHIIDKNKNQVYFDGTLLSTQPYTSFTCPDNLQIFACYNNGTSGYLPSSAKIYSLKIYDNDKLVRDFIPCYRISTGDVGLYDTVTGYFYPNAGTGNFLKGSNL